MSLPTLRASQVVGGLETLAAFEKVPTDSGDKPLEPIRITGVEIFVDPYGALRGSALYTFLPRQPDMLPGTSLRKKSSLIHCWCYVRSSEEECQARKAELQTKMAKEAEEADIRNRTGEKARMYSLLLMRSKLCSDPLAPHNCAVCVRVRDAPGVLKLFHAPRRAPLFMPVCRDGWARGGPIRSGPGTPTAAAGTRAGLGSTSKRRRRRLGQPGALPRRRRRGQGARGAGGKRTPTRVAGLGALPQQARLLSGTLGGRTLGRLRRRRRRCSRVE